MYDEPQILLAGDKSLVIELGNEITPELNRLVHGIPSAIENADIEGLIDLIPTYRSVLINYEPSRIPLSELQSRILDIYTNLDEIDTDKTTLVHLPVLYGGDYGPDLEFVSRHTGLSRSEVIDLHSCSVYLIYMMGFSPGFAYLGGLNELLKTPRLENPRLKIPVGSVGIADMQTGVYPMESPGGWQLIGRTPVKLFDPMRNTPILLNSGNYIKFEPIGSESEYKTIASSVAKSQYEPKSELVK